MKRTYKCRFYPTIKQAGLLAQTFGCVCFVCNSILRWRTDACYERRKKVGYLLVNARLTALKKEPEYIWLNDVSYVPLQQSLRHQQAVFANSFAGRAVYPAFENKRHKRMTEFTVSAFKYRDGELYIAGSRSSLDVRWSRELPSAPSTVTISRDSASRYSVSCLCEFEPVLAPVTARTVGIDAGLEDLLVAGIKFKTDNLYHAAKYARRLTPLQ